MSALLVSTAPPTKPFRVLARRLPESVAAAVLPRAPVVDGDITEAEWAGAAVLDGRIVQIEPEYGEPSPFRTVVRIGYTALALHVAFEAYGPDPDRLGAIVRQLPFVWAGTSRSRAHTIRRPARHIGHLCVLTFEESVEPSPSHPGRTISRSPSVPAS